MTEKEKHDMFWADQIAKEVIERVEKTPKLRAVTKKYGYIVYDEKNETFLNQIDNPYVRLYELDFKKIREKLKFSFLEHKISKLEIS